MRPFGNPIVSGLDLIRQAIQSPNFQAGVLGWRIARDGSAEFNNVVIRGELLVQDPDGSYVRIYDENPGNGAVIDFGPPTVAAYPNTIEPGQIFSTATGDAVSYESQLFITPAHPSGFGAPSVGLFTKEGMPNPGDYIPQVQLSNGAGVTLLLGSENPTPGLAPDIEIAAPWLRTNGVVEALNLPLVGTTFTPTITGGGAFNLGSAVPLGVIYQAGEICHVKIQLTWTAAGGANQGTGGWNFGNFPTMTNDGLTQSAIVGRWWYVKPASASRASGDILMNPGSSTVACQVGGGLPTLGAFTQLGQNLPEAWLAGSILTMEFSFPG